MSDRGHGGNPNVNYETYIAREVRLYGRHPSSAEEKQDILQSIQQLADIDPSIKSIGIIYGYAYEGHCYKLPRPQIMLLPEEPEAVLDGDCGYSPELGYSVWKIDKMRHATVLDVRSDDLKTLILDANTPGNRSPLAYAQVMMLAPHRSSHD